jgi:peroxiredoxin Q/BCP
MSKALAIGTKAPDFTLENQHHKPVSLSDFSGKHYVVLFFFPKSFTPGCTRQACQFRDSYAAFQDIGAVVLGVSSDSADTQASFANEKQLPFDILSDPGGEVRKRYQVPSTLGFLLGDLLPGRVTFVIDQQGIIRHQFDSQFNPDAHIKQALSILQQLKE